MPLPSDTKYPAIATDAAWQKKKSTTDKVHKTKVGPALVEAERKWKAIKFADLDSKKVSKTPGAAEAALDKAEKAWPAVTDAREALKDAWEIAEPWSTNTKLSSASRTALKAIVKALKDADRRLDLMDDVIPAMKVDVNNTLKDALANIKNLEVKQGNNIIAHAKSATLQSNKSYLVKDVTWRVPVNNAMLNLLQKKVSVSFHDGSGRLVNKEMIIDGITGTDEMRLK